MTADELKVPAEDALDEGFRRRLEELLNLFETRKSAAQVAGKSVDQLQAYLKGRSAVPLHPIARLCAAKEVSLDWLATGRSGTGAPSPGLREPAAAFAAMEASVEIPPYSGLDGTLAGDEGEHAAESRGITLSGGLVSRALHRPADRLATVVAVGEAMAPTISGGDLVVVDTGDLRLSDGCLYALKVERQPLLRRVARQAGGGVRLIADHPGYADEVVPPRNLAQLAVIGRIVWGGCPR